MTKPQNARPHKLPPFVQAFVDRYGTPRFYLRKHGLKRVPLPGLPWTPEFMEAYERARSGEWEASRIGDGKIVAGTVDAAVIDYLANKASPFAALAQGTRDNYRRVLENFRKEHGSKRIGLMSREALHIILSSKTPGAARLWRNTLRSFVNHCLALGLLKTDPLIGIKLTKTKKSSGYPTWSEDEIAQYKARHASGTRARLALELLLQTGHARADVVRMGRQHVDKHGKLSMRRQKTNVQFDIPLLPDLLAEIERHPKTGLAFLENKYGRPFKNAASFGMTFKRWCVEANLPHCSAHGLRKAAAVRHALIGATASELMAWFGWKSISEAQRYVEEANRIRLAENAGAKIVAASGGIATGTNAGCRSVKLDIRFDNPNAKPLRTQG